MLCVCVWVSYQIYPRHSTFSVKSPGFHFLFANVSLSNVYLQFLTPYMHIDPGLYVVKELETKKKSICIQVNLKSKERNQ